MRFLVGCMLFGICSAALAGEEEVLFSRDVMPVLTKAGCNSGGCHGAKGGKGALELTLFGGDRVFDYKAITASEQRVNLADVEASWVLRKPTLGMPHEGGLRFEVGSESYEILRRWIAGGAKDDPEGAPVVEELVVSPEELVLEAPDWEVGLEVRARFSDGEVRDVTRWARYASSNLSVAVSGDGVASADMAGETTVMVSYGQMRVPVRLAFLSEREGWKWNGVEALNGVDERVFGKLQKVKTNPSALCDDATFLRRVSLDIAGRLPTGEEARAFVSSDGAGKREAVVDRLLASDGFADYWALKWADLLRVEEKTLDTEGVRGFHGWIRESMASGKRLDDFAWEILSATGKTFVNPPANFYRALREPTMRSERVAQVFLGTRINCARCHNHPFEKWTQDDYYRFAALFDGIDYEILNSEKKDGNDKHLFKGEQRVHVFGKRKLKDPRTGKLPPVGMLVSGAAPISDEKRRLEEMASWVAAVDNRQFAEVQANRIWYHLMGRGVVDPPDDFRSTNPASNPELLDYLADELVASGFDLRSVVRLIVASRTYQASSVPEGENAEDEVNFSRAVVRRRDGEVLLDAVNDVLGTRVEFYGEEKGVRAVQVPGVIAVFGRVKDKEGDGFVKAFGKPPRMLNSDVERVNEASLEQVFALTSGETLEGLLGGDNRLDGWLEGGDVIGELYWTALGRPAGEEERAGLLAHLDGADDRRKALEDVVWGVLNSKEFLFRN